MVISHKMKRTLVVRRDFLQYFPKYRRFGKKHRNMSVHCSPAFPNVGEGDIVTIGQCRPLAKTVRFNVIEHVPAVNKVCLSFLFFFSRISYDLGFFFLHCVLPS
jgi:small subunit ribosomal protein S11e